MQENGFWSEKKVLVTGARGFIGTWIVKELVEKNAKVFCLARELSREDNFARLGLDKKTTLIQGDILNLDFINECFKKYGFDTVFHLAAQPLAQTAMKRPLETIKINVIGTTNILEACRLNPGVERIVISSTDRVYTSDGKPPYDESCQLKGEYPYDVSKACADLISQAYAKTYGLPVAITRCSNIYGGGDMNFDRIIPETIKHILFKEPILLRSDGKFRREFFYVKDAARAYLMLAEKISQLGFRGEAFNFGTDSPISVLELVDKIRQIAGSSAEIKILNNVKGEIKDQFLSSLKAREKLGWRPEYSLELGLRESIEWYKNYFKI